MSAHSASVRQSGPTDETFRCPAVVSGDTMNIGGKVNKTALSLLT